MIGKKLKELRAKHGMTQEDLASALSIERSSIGKYESPSKPVTPPPDMLLRIANYFDVSVDYLLDNPAPSLHAPSDTGGHIWIPVLGEVAAGIPIQAVEDIVDYEQISADMSSSGEFFGLRLKGQSMEPRMCDGDVVIVKKQSCAENGDIAVILVNGDAATVKKIRRNESGITLIPLNPAFDAVFYTNEEIEKLPISIIGVVVELRAKFG